MDERVAALLGDETIRTELRRAWEESSPGVTGGHEEGGFICVDSENDFVVDRWGSGKKSEIFAPPHPNGKRNNETIVATFHTHPNTGTNFMQEPNTEDCTIVTDDEDLRTVHYVGEFVISNISLYFIFPDGEFVTLGDRESLLSL